MSAPNEPPPEPHLPDPPAKRSGLATVAKLLLILLAVGAGLTVLVFGTCVFLFSR